MQTLDKGLYIISTPIGNLNDISFRAKQVLTLVDLVVCENPKHSLKLLNKLGIKKKLFSLHDYNEDLLIKRIEKYQDNSSIALISDAGAPLISDPGYNLVRHYISKKINIITIPGPSSIISALQLSGLPINNFEFFGFVSKNKNTVKELATEIKCLKPTSVFFVSGSRLRNFLTNLLIENIDKKIAVCKEITKKNERIFRGSINEVINEVDANKNNLRGEFVVVIEGSKKETKRLIDISTETEIKKLLIKFSLTEVVEIVHKLTSISKKDIYKKALEHKND